MKIDFIADTNFLIYVHEGNPIVEPFIEYDFGVSFISELELLGYRDLTPPDERKLKALLNDCFLIEWSTKLKERTIQIKRKHPIKLPDAIIAATSLIYQIPLVTADKGYTSIEELDLFLIEL
jgi:predicted nucleic acid-binding protein